MMYTPMFVCVKVSSVHQVTLVCYYTLKDEELHIKICESTTDILTTIHSGIWKLSIYELGFDHRIQIYAVPLTL